MWPSIKTSPAMGNVSSSSVSSLTSPASIEIIEILHAQQHGHSRNQDETISCPPFTVAYSEIIQGQKTSHWIWYVWPSFSAVRSNVGHHAKKFLLHTFSDVVHLVTHPTLSMNLTTITTAATKQLLAGVSPSTLFGKQHKYDAPKFIEGCMCYAVACALVSSSSSTTTTTTASLDIYVNALRAMRDSVEKKRYKTTMQRTTTVLQRHEDVRVRQATEQVSMMLLPLPETSHQSSSHPLSSFYQERGYHVLIVSHEQMIASESSSLLGTPVRREDLATCINIQENYGNRVVVLETGSEVPVFIFVSGMLHESSEEEVVVESSEEEVVVEEREEKEEKQEKEKEEKEERKVVQRSSSPSPPLSSPPPPNRASAHAALKLGTSRLSTWYKHAAPPMMHTGYTTPMVRSFAFAYKSDSQTNPLVGLCAVHGLPCVRARSTLLQNQEIIRGEFAPLIQWLDSSYETNVNPDVVNKMNFLMERCHHRWAILSGTKFTALGIHLNFAQHYHIDEADVPGSLSVAVYDVLNPDHQLGGEVIFPQLQMYLRPRHGDVLYWRTRSVVHGVAPFVENTTLRRVSWVLFQTEDCYNGCLECSRD